MGKMLTFFALVAAFVAAVSGQIRVDDKREFRLCPKPQLAKVERVDVIGCRSWPCFIIPGGMGTFQVTFSHNLDTPIYNMHSSIYAHVNMPRFANLGGNGITRVAMRREVNQPACPITSPGCPVQPNVRTSITKTIQVPPNARMVPGPMIVEFQVTDGRGRVVTCFMAPVHTN